MCGNPFKLRDEVGWDVEVEKATTKIRCSIPNINFKWRFEDEYVEVLTLSEILKQVKEVTPGNRTPYIRVEYESGLWGAIFVVGNYKEMGDTWMVQGITTGYA